MPTSSVVWWWSICRSPLALTVTSMREWRASEIEHVVEETDPGRNRRRAGAVEIDRDLDLGLLGGALDRAFAHESGRPSRRLLSGDVSRCYLRLPGALGEGPGCLILRGGTLTPGGFAIKHRPDK